MQDEKLASAYDPKQWAAAQKAVDAMKHEEKCKMCLGDGTHPFGDTGQLCDYCNGTGKTPSFFPALISKIEMPPMEQVLNAPAFSRCQPGDWVAVRLANDTEGKTHLGIYLGEFSSRLDALLYKDGTLKITTTLGNPAMWVPDLKRIVRGYESWWASIKSEQELRAISDLDIENVWYVRAMKELAEKAKATEASE